MITAITIFIIAVSNAVAVYYGSRRADKLQEQITDLAKQIYDNKFQVEQMGDHQRAINDNLDKQIKSQYSHFTSRIDKTRNDVLQNSRAY